MRVPDALADQFGNEVSRALGDVTKAQAEVECRRLGHEYADRFLVARHRLGLAAQPPVPAPAPQRVATPTEVRDLGRASARRMLALDEEARIEGAESELWDWWRSELSDLDRAITRALSEGDMRDLWHDFRKELTKNGLALPDERSERRRLVHSWALEHGRALRDIDARERGHPVDTPPPVVPTKAYRMRDAFDAWKAAAVRPPKTIEAFGRHVATFETMMGDPVLSSLRRADAIRFRDALQSWAVDKKRTARTADNVLATVKALANVAIDREWLGQDRRNPFERLAVLKGGKESEGREPWTPEDLVTLFDSPLFTAYALPNGDSIATKGGADAAYWVPLIAAYTGARPGELCQLWTDDVSESPSGMVVEFRAKRAWGQSLKNQGSWRAVPVHSELIRLGFRDYWLRTRANGEGSLFPLIPKEGDNGPAGQFGQWFGEFKRAQGFESATKTLHSFRYTVETELGFAGVSPTLVDAITGHEGKGIGRKVYGATIRRGGRSGCAQLSSCCATLGSICRASTARQRRY